MASDQVALREYALFKVLAGGGDAANPRGVDETTGGCPRVHGSHSHRRTQNCLWAVKIKC